MAVLLDGLADDEKIRSTALRYIEQHSIEQTTSRWTLVGHSHPEVSRRAELQPGDLDVVSFFLSQARWYLLTTRRVLGTYAGRRVDAPAIDVIENRFGNFKGYDGPGTEFMVLRFSGGAEGRLKYETGRASMAPIYYLRYWKNKFPILDRLRG